MVVKKTRSRIWLQRDDLKGCRYLPIPRNRALGSKPSASPFDYPAPLGLDPWKPNSTRLGAISTTGAA